MPRINPDVYPHPDHPDEAYFYLRRQLLWADDRQRDGFRNSLLSTLARTSQANITSFVDPSRMELTVLSPQYVHGISSRTNYKAIDSFSEGEATGAEQLAWAIRDRIPGADDGLHAHWDTVRANQIGRSALRLWVPIISQEASEQHNMASDLLRQRSDLEPDSPSILGNQVDMVYIPNRLGIMDLGRLVSGVKLVCQRDTPVTFGPIEVVPFTPATDPFAPLVQPSVE